jgi:hypothetical protein
LKHSQNQQISLCIISVLKNLKNGEWADRQLAVPIFQSLFGDVNHARNTLSSICANCCLVTSTMQEICYLLFVLIVIVIVPSSPIFMPFFFNVKAKLNTELNCFLFSGKDGMGSCS